jgi:hypothetical protein
MSEPKHSPKDFLRERRPERFSDSSVEEVTESDRSLLEYHLDTITSRSQETEFERFCRELIKVEICPNLLPQTGPTGGGDSKVDSETYPVAESLALAWIVGAGSDAASERWAFAFSAKKRWQDKLKSDIAKIDATNRGYTKAFFITNQFVRDKARGELEDELRKVHSLDVRILDRTWILDVVFDHGRQDIAIDELGASSTIRKHVVVGPIDFQRKTDLDKIESRIAASVEANDVGFVTVDDCIAAASLSRGLERPQTETMGRFERADNLAMKFGTCHQRVRCAYDRTWTTFFWFEDIEKFAECYDIVEERAGESQSIYDIELLSNLWMLLHGYAQDYSDVDRHAECLLTQLKQFAANEAAPSASLQARALTLKIELIRMAQAGLPFESHLREFSKIIRQSESLVGFPFEPLVEVLMAMGEFLGDVPEYEKLHDQLVDVVSRRQGDIAGAKVLLRRAEQKLKADRPVDALASLGKVLHRLAKEESRHFFARALLSCACAYERIGLLWAARGSLLVATNVSMSDYWNYEDVTPFQAVCFRHLKWIELRIGRIPWVLSWHEADAIVRGVLAAQDHSTSHLDEGNRDFDATFGSLLLKTEFWNLKDLTRLPDRLSELGLELSSTALLYALGYESDMAALLEVPEDEDVSQFSLKWRDKLSNGELSRIPMLCDEATTMLRSNVLGCKLEVTSPNSSPFTELGESFLAALEATLATGIVRHMIAREPKFVVTIRRSEFCKEPFEFSIKEEDGVPHLRIDSREFKPDGLGIDQQKQIKKQITELVAHAIAYIVVFEEKELKQLFGEDSGFARVDFTGSFQVLGNVLGTDRKSFTTDWTNEEQREYTNRRNRAWDDSLTVKNVEVESTEISQGDAELPEHYENDKLQTVAHSNVEFKSLIQETWWNEADWRGVGYFACEDSPPFMVIIFKNQRAAEKIFARWKRDLGEVDDNEFLRVAVLRHISKKYQHHYRVILGSRVRKEDYQDSSGFLMVKSRVNTMTPTSSKGLDAFLEAYKTHEMYFVMPGFMERDGTLSEPGEELRILKRELDCREAWEIGLNDLDCVGILPGDTPIIPGDVIDPPVSKLLASKIMQRTVKSQKPSKDSQSQKDKRKKKKQKRKQVKKSRRKK